MILRDRVALLQAKRGYRTSIDSLLLAAVAAEALAGSPPSALLDLGAGSGLVSLLLGLAWPETRLRLVELQPILASRALRNLALNGLGGRCEVIVHDLGDGAPATPLAPLVVSNPPYFRGERGTLPPDDERRRAHYESSAPLEAFCRVAADAVAPGGLVAVVYPFEGHVRLLDGLAAAGLGAQALWPFVHLPDAATPRRVVVAARRGPPHIARMPARALHLTPPPEGRYGPPLEAFVEALPVGATSRAAASIAAAETTRAAR